MYHFLLLRLVAGENGAVPWMVQSARGSQNATNWNSPNGGGFEDFTIDGQGRANCLAVGGAQQTRVHNVTIYRAAEMALHILPASHCLSLRDVNIQNGPTADGGTPRGIGLSGAGARFTADSVKIHLCEEVRFEGCRDIHAVGMNLEKVGTLRFLDGCSNIFWMGEMQFPSRTPIDLTGNRGGIEIRLTLRKPPIPEGMEDAAANKEATTQMFYLDHRGSQQPLITLPIHKSAGRTLTIRTGVGGRTVTIETHN